MKDYLLEFILNNIDLDNYPNSKHYVGYNHVNGNIEPAGRKREFLLFLNGVIDLIGAVPESFFFASSTFISDTHFSDFLEARDGRQLYEALIDAKLARVVRYPDFGDSVSDGYKIGSPEAQVIDAFETVLRKKFMFSKFDDDLLRMFGKFSDDYSGIYQHFFLISHELGSIIYIHDEWGIGAISDGSLKGVKFCTNVLNMGFDSGSLDVNLKR